MENKPKIYFLGSGMIAVPILKVLATAEELELIGVGTQLDRPAGRNRRPTPTPVGVEARKIGLEPECIASVNDEVYLDRLKNLRPDLIVVVSFGQILRIPLLTLPKKGCVNIHASLLPRYRGASPIAQCILNRDAETGICFMAMESGIDTGAIYEKIKVPLDHSEYANQLAFKLGCIAAEATPGVLCSICRGELVPIPQDSVEATVCTKIRKGDGIIRWNKPAYEIEAMVRAFFPWPGAYASIRTQKGIENVTLVHVNSRLELSGAPGQILRADKYGLVVACGKGAIEILELAPPGRRIMSAVAYLNGLRGEKPEFLS